MANEAKPVVAKKTCNLCKLEIRADTTHFAREQCLEEARARIDFLTKNQTAVYVRMGKLITLNTSLTLFVFAAAKRAEAGLNFTREELEAVPDDAAIATKKNEDGSIIVLCDKIEAPKAAMPAADVGHTGGY